MWKAIGSFLSVVFILVANYFSHKEKERKAKTPYEHDIEKFDQALGSGDADDLTRMFDRMRVPGEGEAGGDPGGPDHQGAA